MAEDSWNQCDKGISFKEWTKMHKQPLEASPTEPISDNVVSLSKRKKESVSDVLEAAASLLKETPEVKHIIVMMYAEKSANEKEDALITLTTKNSSFLELLGIVSQGKHAILSSYATFPEDE